MTKLYFIATPIGNLKDITFRAIEALKDVDLILAEDTRESLKLLQHYEIKKPILSFEKNHAKKRSIEVIEDLRAGKNIALISDAGTPGIADPGFELISAIKAAGLIDQIEIIPLPGACAVTTALSISGFDAGSFDFGGFIPAKSEARKKYLEEKLPEEKVLAFYEAPHRIEETLEDLKSILSKLSQQSRPIMLARELTKKFETHYFGTANEVLNKVKAGVTKGEWVIIIGPWEAKAPNKDWMKLLEIMSKVGVKKSDQVKILSAYFGLSRNELYKEIAID